MQGQILDYSVQTNSGYVTGDDGNRYLFGGADWRGNRPPANGLRVDFTVEGELAKEVYVVAPAAGTTPGEKNKLAAGLLAIFLGGWGIHKFYLGFTTSGLIYLLTNTIGLAVTWILLFIPNIVLGVMALIEGIIYLTKSDAEFYQTYEVQKKQWF